ncbi:MAG TPA: hypothetical protein VJ997_10225 [Longimicrobiales bacterium]|nr:hypothetical protein [Longimicrobiales bacterium]
MRTSYRRTFPAVLALCAALGACASGGGGGGSARSSSGTLRGEELQTEAVTDLFSVIQRRRPQWLTNRAPATARGRQEIAVIIDGIRQQGTVEILRSMRATDVESVSYMNARDATTRYGTDMTAGAILVSTKR